MASYYWIKLYTELLHDRKVGLLSDNLWRRMIECFLMAGETNQNGKLPSIEIMTWVTRIPKNQLIGELDELSTLGVLTKYGDGWEVTNWTKRQSALSSAERQRYRRARISNVTNVTDVPNVTDESRNVTVSRIVTPVSRNDVETSRSGNERYTELRIKKGEAEEDRVTDRDISATATAITTHPSDLIPGIPGSYTLFERIWTAVTNMPSFLASSRERDIDRIEGVFARNNRDFEKTVNELKRYFDAWCNSISPKTHRPYNRTNTGWLDWAIAQEAGGSNKPEVEVNYLNAAINRINNNGRK